MKKILVPVDFYEVSEAAVHFAVDLAKKKNAAVRLLNSAKIDYFNDYQYPAFTNTKKLYEEVLDSMNQRMERMVKEFENDQVEVTGKVSELGLIIAIKDEIADEGVDLCVVGTTGCSGLEEVFIGSNTERIVRQVPCPVISVPHTVAIDSIKKVMIPIDLREIRESFLKKVASLQEMLDCQLEFVWVKTPHNIENEEKVGTELKAIFERNGLENYKLFIVKSVFPSDGILMEAEDSKSDMIAMATHARRGIAHWLSGSLTEDTVNHVQVPVWSFKIDKAEKPLRLDAVTKAEGMPDYQKIEHLAF